MTTGFSCLGMFSDIKVCLGGGGNSYCEVWTGGVTKADGSWREETAVVAVKEIWGISSFLRYTAITVGHGRGDCDREAIIRVEAYGRFVDDGVTALAVVCPGSRRYLRLLSLSYQVLSSTLILFFPFSFPRNLCIL